MTSPKTTFEKLSNTSSVVATWFGLGLIPKAPGTWGSLGAIPPALIIFHIGGLYVFIAVLILLTPVAFWATAQYEKSSGIHDNKEIVIDEVIGQWITLMPCFIYEPENFFWVILAFALFRLFDITKPGPVGYCDQKIEGANGVMFDDIIAGCLAALVLTGGIHAGLG